MQLTKDSQENKKHTAADIIKILAIILSIVGVMVAFIFVGRSMGKLLGAVAAAVIGSYLLIPLQLRLEKRLCKGLSALLCVLVLFGTATGILIWLFPIMLREIISASKQIGVVTEYLEDIFDVIEDRINELNIPVTFDSLLSGATQLIKNKAGDFVDRLISVVISFFKSLPVIITVPVMMFYMLKDRAYFLSAAEFMIPVNRRESLKKTLKEADLVLKSYIRSQLLLALLVGSATALGYAVLGVPWALLLGGLMGICELIPYFGPIIGAIPACVLVLSSSPDKLIWTVAVITAVQQLENCFLSPYVMGTSFDINPVTVITVLWVSGRVVGFAGFVFGIPIYVIVKNITVGIYNKLVKT